MHLASKSPCSLKVVNAATHALQAGASASVVIIIGHYWSCEHVGRLTSHLVA
jgi:hypothetical protein